MRRATWLTAVLLLVCAPVALARTVRGDAKPNRLKGGDALCGEAGDDVLTGGSGLDVFCGGETGLTDTGAGDDTIDARDEFGEQVHCGEGNDRVVADMDDEVGADCEVVERG